MEQVTQKSSFQIDNLEVGQREYERKKDYCAAYLLARTQIGVLRTNDQAKDEEIARLREALEEIAHGEGLTREDCRYIALKCPEVSKRGRYCG